MKAALDGRTHFSIGESLLTPKELIEGAQQHGYSAVTMADTMTISGMPEFVSAAKKSNIKPIIACRLRIVPTLDREKRMKAVFPKLFILSERGYKAVLSLLTLANDDDHFYYQARLTWNDTETALSTLTRADIALSGGTLYSALRDADSVSRLRSLSARFDVYSEVCPINSAVWRKHAEVGFSISEFKPLVSLPILYKDGQSDSLAVMNAIANNRKRDMSADFQAYVKNYNWTSKGQMVQAIVDFSKFVDGNKLREGVKNADALADAVTWVWDKQPVTLPKMSNDEDEELARVAKDGLRERIYNPTFGDTIDKSAYQTYVSRLAYELDVLKRLKFAGYFLLTRDIVSWSKSQGIEVGPGRGSVGGSLVAYALGITDIDPIRFDLLFERFINPDRIDLPDADLDFMSTRRHEVLDYIVRTYGRDYVAGVSNYTTLASGSAIRDVGRIYNLSNDELEVSKFVPKLHGQPVSLEQARDEVSAISSFAARNVEIWKHALALEGRNRSLGRHAAGVVIAGEPLVNRAIIERRSGEQTVNWDKYSVEDMGLVKMDILGLSTLDTLAIAVANIHKTRGKKIDLRKISLDDAAVLQRFRDGDTHGVFQFEGHNSRRILREVGKDEPLTFMDIAAITALNRPGPMDSGLLDDFIAIKQGMLAPHYEHPLMKPALEKTYSVIVFQEQVQRIAVDLCGFSLPKSDHLRKAIGKKDKEKMATLRDDFVQGAQTNGMSQASAERLWDKIEKFAGYAFNASHAFAYTLISYQAMWLKHYFPAEFFAAAVQIADDEKRVAILNDAKRSGVKLLPPDINISTDKVEVLNDTTLVAPFSVVKGISERGQKAILDARGTTPFVDMKDFTNRTPGRSANAAVRKRLEEIGAFSRIVPGSLPANDPSRKQALLDHCPSIVLGGADITRMIPRGTKTKKELDDLCAKMAQLEDFDTDPVVKPYLGKHATFMVITDGPTWSEEEAGSFAKGKTFDYLDEALKANGLSREDGYWTGLCKLKKAKGQAVYSPSMISNHLPFLRMEMELFKPQAIILLGGTAIRTLLALKGSPNDAVGKIIYEKESSAGSADDKNWVVGFNPAMIAFDEAKQETLNDIFRKVAEMIP